ncbi:MULTISPECIES: hypothetical protein [Cupriavidus]|uniref:hypothetical protein n=1 Tax=Cupriavidus sp. DF5525 TaxID=3160989 RepID=UPI00041BFF80
MHQLGDALAAGIAPAPMRAMAGDLAVVALGVNVQGDPALAQWRHGSGDSIVCHRRMPMNTVP